MADRRVAAACSMSIGRRRMAWVPRMASATPGGRRDRLPSCCATQPATATIGSWPCSAAIWRSSPSRVSFSRRARGAAGVDHHHVGVHRGVGRLEAGLLGPAIRSSRGRSSGSRRFRSGIYAPCCFALGFMTSLSPFRFRLASRVRSPASRADRRRPSVIASRPTSRQLVGRPLVSRRTVVWVQYRPLRSRNGCRRERQSAAGAMHRTGTPTRGRGACARRRRRRGRRSTSTSSKISPGADAPGGRPAASLNPCRDVAIRFGASMIRDSSPPDTMRASGRDLTGLARRYSPNRAARSRTTRHVGGEGTSKRVRSPSPSRLRAARAP